MQKIYNISLKGLSLCTIKSQSYIVMNSQVFIAVPKVIKIKINSSFLVFEYVKITRSILNFLKRYSLWLSYLKKKLIRKVLLRGLGLKMLLSEDNKYIEFKLGFSHIIRVLIPELLAIKIHKNILTISGYNLYSIGNFVNKIKSLKKINAYKGKGVFSKHETFNPKVINKK